MLETVIKSTGDFYSIFIVIILLNILFKNLKIINFSFLIFILLVSNVYFQNYILKKYSFFYNPNTTLIYDKNYDVVILGGNYLKRTENYLKLQQKIQIDTLLFINDQNIFEENILLFNLDPEINLIYENSSSTIEDIQIISNNLDLLTNDLIIITDDFHLPRLNKYLIKLNKNILFSVIENFEDFDKNKIFDVNRGVYFFNAMLRELLAIIYYNLKGY